MRAARIMVAGVDGCRAGWVVVSVPRIGDGPAEVQVQPDLRAVVAEVEAGRLAVAAVDIPIGLPSRGPRTADVLARARLGPRRGSVFPAPARAVLGATDYLDACMRSRRACGKAISKQLFNILPKIADADAAVSPALQARIVEVCPELSFALLTGTPMPQAKSTAEGRSDRLEALAPVFADVDRHAERPPRGARADDVVDAFAAAWTARRVASADHVAFGGETDERGLRMEVVA